MLDLVLQVVPTDDSLISFDIPSFVQGFWSNTFSGLTYGGVYGLIALATATLALLSKRPWAAWLAAAAGVFALELYCFEPGALALLIGCLRLLRLQMRPSTPPLGQHRQRDQQTQSQP